MSDTSNHAGASIRTMGCPIAAFNRFAIKGFRHHWLRVW